MTRILTAMPNNTREGDGWPEGWNTQVERNQDPGISGYGEIHWPSAPQGDPYTDPIGGTFVTPARSQDPATGVNMHGEAREDSRIYMAGRDQYITQGIILPIEKIKREAAAAVCIIAPMVCGWFLHALWESDYPIPGQYLCILIFMPCLGVLNASIHNGVYFAEKEMPEGFVGRSSYLASVCTVALISMGVFFLFLFRDIPHLDSWGQSVIHLMGRIANALNDAS